tara:strand:+ start:1125 stop:1718 length:594 start_codon:yes stop_codon:yes gene_type:complete
MIILELNLKKKWFSMILDGTKTEEYREIKKHWDKRFKKKDSYTHIRFRNGYAKNAPQFLIELKSIRIGTGNPDWGAPEKEVYILELGDIIAGEGVVPIVVDGEDWRNHNYPLAIITSNHGNGKAHIFTSVILDEGELPDPMFCLADPNYPAKILTPKDRPVPPGIPKPSIEWRKVGDNPILVPMPITTHEADWPTYA